MTPIRHNPTLKFSIKNNFQKRIHLVVSNQVITFWQDRLNEGVPVISTQVGEIALKILCGLFGLKNCQDYQRQLVGAAKT